MGVNKSLDVFQDKMYENLQRFLFYVYKYNPLISITVGWNDKL